MPRLTDQERCRSKKYDGTRCPMPVTPGTRLCHFHNVDGPVFDLNPGDPEPIQLSFDALKTPESVQLAIARICEHVLIGKLDPKRAGVILYALQVATSNLARLKPQASQAPALTDQDALPPGTIQACEANAPAV